jgi:hypothetical protein
MGPKGGAMANDSGVSSEQIKHLELIQPVVARLGTNSFLIKGWALTITAGFLALLATRQSPALAVVGLVPLLAFWNLDAMFLRQERMYRSLYEFVRMGSDRVITLSMDVSGMRREASWWAAVTSGTLLGFYGPLVLVDLLLPFVVPHL